MLQLFKTPNFKFIARRYYAFAFSGLLTIITIVSIVTHKGLRYGVDFTGGTLLELNFQSPISTDELRGAFRNLGLGNATIQKFGEGSQFIVRFETQQGSSESAESTSARVVQQLQLYLQNNPPELSRIEMVGPRIGKELQKNATLAVVIGLILILFYVTIRFDFRFGTAACMALAHDVMTTLGFISIMRIEISIPIIAAILTLIGYSVNNSIVISDRVRENRRKTTKDSLTDIINHSINQTLTRTILTSFTVFMVAMTLLLLGAAAIKDFAKVISFGVVMGTYSAIFIGAPLVAEWEKRFPSRRRR